MDSNLANRFAPYESFPWNQNPIGSSIFPSWHHHNTQLMSRVPFGDTDREAPDNLMATPSATNHDVNLAGPQLNRHNFYNTQGIYTFYKPQINLDE